MTDARMPPPEDADAPAPAASEAVSAAGSWASSADDTGPAPAAAASEEDGMPAAEASPAPRPSAPQVEPASPDIDIVPASSMLPGEHRGGFFRLPTAPVAVTTQSAPAEPTNDLTAASAQWLASDEPGIHRGLAGWALAFAIIGLIVSLFVGWGFPIGLVAVVSAVFALRRPLESRAVAVWAIVIGSVSILYSAGWLLYAALRANLFG
ncbi:hypothetical protein [Microbacterium jejuense]|uniref:hypothetical protein n=1 Tax=Microbacterium jejuense TaxID=1263637 RepID=UPI0031EE596B